MESANCVNVLQKWKVKNFTIKDIIILCITWYDNQFFKWLDLTELVEIYSMKSINLSTYMFFTLEVYVLFSHGNAFITLGSELVASPEYKNSTGANNISDIHHNLRYM